MFSDVKNFCFYLLLTTILFIIIFPTHVRVIFSLIPLHFLKYTQYFLYFHSVVFINNFNRSFRPFFFSSEVQTRSEYSLLRSNVLTARFFFNIVVEKVMTCRFANRYNFATSYLKLCTIYPIEDFTNRTFNVRVKTNKQE